MYERNPVQSNLRHVFLHLSFLLLGSIYLFLLIAPASVFVHYYVAAHGLVAHVLEFTAALLHARVSETCMF